MAELPPGLQGDSLDRGVLTQARTVVSVKGEDVSERGVRGTAPSHLIIRTPSVTFQKQKFSWYCLHMYLFRSSAKFIVYKFLKLLSLTFYCVSVGLLSVRLSAVCVSRYVGLSVRPFILFHLIYFLFLILLIICFISNLYFGL